MLFFFAFILQNSQNYVFVWLAPFFIIPYILKPVASLCSNLNF